MTIYMVMDLKKLLLVALGFVIGYGYARWRDWMRSRREKPQ